MHDFPLLINITVSLVAAVVGGLLARLVKLPTMVGYLLGGVVIGPFTPGYVGDINTIKQLADLGIVFLMFGVGLHFSIQDLWMVRRIAFPGALLQLLVLTPLVMLVTLQWGWSLPSSLLVGLAVPIATSTVVMLRNLMDQGLLNTVHGKVAIGWLVLEDLLTVLALVLIPALSSTASEAPLWQTIGLALLKAIAFAAVMLLAGTRVIPKVLRWLSFTHSRELFIVAIVVVTIGTAIGAAAFFGVSLALGAFLAGAVINETMLSQQVENEILPFRETFTVLFFVSIGMLVNPLQMAGHVWEILGLTAVIVLGKYILTLIFGVIFAWPARTTFVLAAGRAQIGEFAFILGETGIALKLLATEQYSVLLASAILAIILNPFLFRFLPQSEKLLARMPALWSRMNKQPAIEAANPDAYHEHVVIIGYGRVGEHIIHLLGLLNVPRVVVELNMQRIQLLSNQDIPTLYGDVASSDILSHAQIQRARAVVITIPDETAAEIAIMRIRKLSREVPIIVRAVTQEGLHRLFAQGATAVIQPELEGGLEIIQQTLLRLGYPNKEIRDYTDSVRNDHYDVDNLTNEERHALEGIQAQTLSNNS
ncbi:sodium/hydrogen exchanger [Dictyobacter alpinus]|uniref:Sodium/hydrogen exchanger n=1 Tax=Dictyobacter alpinus TaxID=2014873 RepID=A0A402BHU1_9CHLR|nr:cation:proton antiporter [Dictyobacter alpinus]GCE30978.1 sodium/hydrogen exchanger [Dictyobacter alpinus]